MRDSVDDGFKECRFAILRQVDASRAFVGTDAHISESKGECVIDLLVERTGNCLGIYLSRCTICAVIAGCGDASVG